MVSGLLDGISCLIAYFMKHIRNAVSGAKFGATLSALCHGTALLKSSKYILATIS
jgi:hypothetical protein